MKRGQVFNDVVAREKTKSQTLLLVLRFRLFHPAQALLNSAPQLLARDCRAVAQNAQLGPRDLRVDARETPDPFNRIASD